MPSLQDIREFNNSLVRLADEESVVREWGEEIEDLPEPEEGLDTDLSSLLADTGDLADADAALGGTFGPDEDAGTPDLDDLFADEVTSDTDFGARDSGPDDGLTSDFAEQPDDVFQSDTEDIGTPEETMAADVQDEEPAFEEPAFEEPAFEEPSFEEPSSEEPLPEPEPGPGATEDVDFSDFAALLSDEPFGETPPDSAEVGAEDDEGSDFDLPTEFDVSSEFDVPPDVDAPLEVETPPDFDVSSEFDLPPDVEAPPDIEAPPEFDLSSEFETPFEADDTVFDDAALDDTVFGETPGEPAETADQADDAQDDAVSGDLDLEDSDELPADDSFAFQDEDDSFSDLTQSEEPEPFEIPDDDMSADFDGFDAGIEAFEFSDEDEPISAPSDDGVTFEEPTVPGAEGEFEEPSIGADASDDVAEVEELDEIDTSGIDEFSLGDFGAEFGVLQDDLPESEEDLNPALSVPDVAPTVIAAGAGSFEITDPEFNSFKETLRSFPLNLKVEVESVITEAKGTTDQVEDLVRRIAAGESAGEIASVVSRILGRQIRIPRGYEKRSGLEFEAERQSFAYQFRENILPIIRLAAVIVVALGLIGLAGYHLVFRPLYSRSLYQEGLALIEEDQYSLGNQTFERAREVWKADRWFYEYAEKFVEERQFVLAAEKYEQLLFGMSEDERNYFSGLLEDRQFGAINLAREPQKQAVLDYARFQSVYLEDYEKADLLLQLILYDDVTDYDGRLAVGDNNMRWAKENPARYEDARIAYAKLIERYGQTNELLFRMLTYFVRTDNLTEVLRLKTTFQAEERVQVDPVRYSEMAGYLIDKNSLDGVEDALFRVMDVDPVLPDVHYQLARYYREVSIPGSEQVALANALRFLEAARPLDGEMLGKLVDTQTRIGENLYDAELFLEAQESFSGAIEDYESGLRRRVLDPDPAYGRAYAGLADILYYEGRQYDDALIYLNLAEENLYHEPNLDYKQGFILYRNGQINTALREFREAAEDPSASTNALLWATANTYYRRGNYYAAEAYYRELLDRVELQYDSIGFLLVEENESHRSVIEYLIRVNNNLGVTLNRQYDETRDPDIYATALVNLTESIEISENYRRDADTLRRSNAVDLAYLNQRGILYPTPDYSLQIYTDLPHDLDDLVF